MQNLLPGFGTLHQHRLYAILLQVISMILNVP